MVAAKSNPDGFKRAVVALAVLSSIVSVIGVDPTEAGASVCPAGSLATTMTWGTSGSASWENTAAHQVSGAYETYTDVAGGVDMTVTVTDPDNRNEDLDNDLLDYVAGSQWDAPTYTRTRSSGGDEYFALVMNSLTDAETVTLEMSFSKPVYVPDLAISDIDSVGYGSQEGATPHESFQDEVFLAASRGGTAIPISVVTGSGATDHGQNRVTANYTIGVNANVAPTDAAGKVGLNPVGPITSFEVAYSNGPDDAAAETVAASGGATWPSPIPQASRGVSNNHGIMISEFTVCSGVLTFGEKVWMDVDGDGLEDSDEPGIEGVVVSLQDELGNTVETQTTDSAGEYSFTEIPGFNWVVSVDPPTGYSATNDRDGTADNSTQFVAASSDVLDVNFGLAPDVGTVSGKTFVDLDHDGVQDVSSAEVGLAGVEIALSGTNIAGIVVSMTTTTIADGTYEFSVIAGTYSIDEMTPTTGYIDGIDTPGTNASANGNDSHLVVLDLGESSTGNDFAEVPAASLSGVVYNDLNDDGSQDGSDLGISGVSMSLVGVDGLGDSVSVATTTDGTGVYEFELLLDGTYTVSEIQPLTYLDGTDVAGTAGGTVGADSVSAVVLDPGESATGYDFAEVSPASLSGAVTLTTGTAVEGVTITLTGTDSQGLVSQSATTDSEGEYSFGGLRPGTYAITESQPVGYADGSDSLGTLGGTLGPDAMTAIVVTGGESGGGYDFVEQASSIGGSVFDDRNGDHVVNGADAGISDVTVTLNGTAASGASISETTTTATDGTWSFVDLASGTYTVSESQPPGTVDGDDLVGSAGGSTTINDQFSLISLPAGTAATDYIFTEAYVSSISGTVTDDLGRAIVGIDVSLSGPITATVQTSSDGSYIFEVLVPGSYSVSAAQPTDYGDGPESLGTVNAVSTGAVASDEFTGIVLSAGASGIDYNFSETTGSLAGRVRTVQGQGISGVEIDLIDDSSGNTVATTATASDGTFAFDGLLLGTYSILESQPSDYVDRWEIDGTINSDQATNDIFAAIALPAGTSATDYTFVESVGGTISGSVDVDGEPLAGVTLELRDGSGALVDTEISGTDGSFSFELLDSGSYSVTEITPAGYGDGSDSGGDSGGTVSNDLVSAISITDREQRLGLSFSEHLGSIAGNVEADGSALAGVTLELRNGSGTLVDTQVSGTDGTYSFDGLLSGTYSVTEVQPTAYGDGGESVGSAGGTASDNLFTGIVLPAGWSASGYDFEETTGSISGLVFHDANSNGELNSGEAGIGGVLITLTGLDADGGLVNATTMTTTAGAWSFTGMLAGVYEISEQQPASYQDGVDLAGDAGGLVTNDAISQIGLIAGFEASGYLFAEQGSAVSGRVVFDTDRDGQVGSNEVDPLANVQIDLVSDTTVVASTTTDENGTYTFPGVGPGDYSIVQRHPEAFEATTPLTLNISVVGVALDELNFGHRGSDLSGLVFKDSDSDGVNDGVASGDLAVPGRSVRLRTVAGVLIATTTTAADGGYTFTDLPAGDYTIEVELDDGETLTVADVGDDDSDSDADQVTRLISVSVGVGGAAGHLDAGTVPEVFDVAVALSGDGSPKVGEDLSLTISVENSGNAPIVGGMTVSLPIDSIWTYVSGAGDGWTVSLVDDVMIAHREGTLLVGQSYPPLSIIVRPNAPGLVESVATVVASVAETDLANNTSSTMFGISEVHRGNTGQLAVTGSALSLLLATLGSSAILAGMLLLLFRRNRLRLATVSVDSRTGAYGGAQVSSFRNNDVV